MISTFFKKRLVPSKIIKDRKIIHIDGIFDDSLIIKGYTLYSENSKLRRAIINGRHPNSNPKNNEFCIPKMLINRRIDVDLLLHLDRAIKTYNFDDCYFSPWSALKIRRVYEGN